MLLVSIWGIGGGGGILSFTCPWHMTLTKGNSKTAVTIRRIMLNEKETLKMLQIPFRSYLGFGLKGVSTLCFVKRTLSATYVLSRANPSHFRQGSAHPRSNPSYFGYGSAHLKIEVTVCQCVRNSPVLTHLSPISEPVLTISGRCVRLVFRPS